GAIISIILKEYIDASIILIVITMNAIIGVIQVYKAEKAIEALNKLTAPTAYVIRDNKLKEIKANQIVVGDIVQLSVGKYIPADIRLINTEGLLVEESMLTGESQAVEKDSFAIYTKEVVIADQLNMVFMSTYVTHGKAKGIVVRTGMKTEVGKIAKMIDEHEEPTPLQLKLEHLSKILGIVCVLICIAMFIIAILQGRDMFEMLLLAISLAVAAIPEGLPAVVTIVLALGVQVMSKKKAIVRKLHSVETLGALSVICSDKTGTLTKNQMQVVECIDSNNQDGKDNDMLMKCLILCNDVYINDKELIGEATEKALVEYATKFGYNKTEEELKYKRINEISFDSTRKMMNTLYSYNNKMYVFAKGAIETILSKCSYIMIDEIKVKLDKYYIYNINEKINELASKALRVIGLAIKIDNVIEDKDMDRGLIFIGMVGLIDPPREEAKESVELAHKAGIDVVMITGDHPNTAYSIAKQLNICNNTNEVMSGKELDKYTQTELNKLIINYHVFARVTPAHKVAIVNAFKSNNKIVSMSGDGVNDAPALKCANIGIAMGNGSDVCKSASDMILADDNFSTIISAVEEGRNIYLNIQKSVLYLLSCNLGEIMALVLAIACMPHIISILSAIQILWVNLVTDAFPALALGIDPKDKYLMKEQPRLPNESLFSNGGYAFTICNGLFIGTITIVAFRYGLNTNETTAQTMAFMVLSISQLFHALNLRSRNHSIFKVGIFNNRFLILTIIFGIALQIIVCSIPFFNIILKTTSLDVVNWIIVFCLSISVIVINEIAKLFK
ncbi:MAG: cation-translocating P-type ATPase, partial [Erysipelotrichaceae bacterium]